MVQMASYKTRFFLLCLFILSVFAPFAGAAEWIKLFDGKSFDGWFRTGGKHTYEIVDQSIVGIAVPKEGNGFMTTKQKYRNFELKFEVKLDLGLNSGCQIRSMPLREGAHLIGPQVEIAGGRSGFLYGEAMKKKDGSRQGWLSPDMEREKTEPIKGAFKPGEWNSFLVRALDDHYQTFINDVPITDFEFDGVSGAGHIGLQVHGVKKPELVGKKVRFRNIYLKEVQSVEERVEDDEAVSATVSSPKLEPALYPYLDTSKGRAGYEFAGEETNTYRTYDFYKRQAKHHLQKDQELNLLPAYTDLDGGIFGHWGNYSENGHKDYRWHKMDYGPALKASHSINIKNRAAKGNMLNLLLPGDYTVTFDHKNGEYFNYWKGRPSFNPHRWGLIHGVIVPTGVKPSDLSAWFGPIERDGQSISRYLGHYTYGLRVIMHYEIGDTRFLENISRMKNGCFVRMVSASEQGAAVFPFKLDGYRDWEIKTNGNMIVATKDGRSIVSAAKSFSKDKGTLLSPDLKKGKWTSSASSSAHKVYYWGGPSAEADKVISSIKADQKTDPLPMWTKGGKTNWPQLFKEKVKIAGNNKAYVIDRIGVPFDNPWGSMMLFSGIDFDQDGAAYICTLMGDLWKVMGLEAGLKEVIWKRYATGLDQPFGLRVIDGLPYVMTRGGIVCLKDLNEDDEADYYEEYFSFPSYKYMGHTGTFGFHMDKERNMYFVNSTSAYRKPWNKDPEQLASGMRNAMAVGASQDGVFLIGPQEGIWTPSSAVLEMQKGDYYGMGPDHLNKDSYKENDKKITPAMAYIPRGIDNSTGGFEFPVSERFGPLSGEIVGLSYGYGSWYQILRNDDYADYNRAQGTIVPLAGEFRSGGMRGAINPKDGMFYAVGSDGWGNYSLDDGSLERVRYTGKPYPMLKKVHGYENGIELQFSSKLSGEAASQTKSYFVQQWNYEYSPAYGSLEYSVKRPSQEGHDRVRVKSVKILPDQKSVFLEIPNLLPALQTHIFAELETEEGLLEMNAFATLVHLDKAKKGFAEPMPALKSRTTSLRIRGSKADKERVALNTANTPKGRMRAGETLFKMFCIGCHGPEGKGLPSIAPTLHSDWVSGDREILVKVLLKGLGGQIKVNGELENYEAAMPGFGPALGDDEIASILSYVRSAWTDAPADVTSAFVRKIRSAEKGKTGPYEANALWKN